MPEHCQSCKEERASKRPALAPMPRIQLPLAVTNNGNFRKRSAPTYVCAYCDGETLINTARATHKKRQEPK